MKIEPVNPCKVVLHEGDLPHDLEMGDEIAVDTETLGLNLRRDRLCLVQVSSGYGAHLVRFKKDEYQAPNLKKLLADQNRLKIFHFARFDLAAIYTYLGVLCQPIYCTKIAAKVACTNKDRHGLREMCRFLLGVDLNKQAQSSNWASSNYTNEQMQYAANDVLYLRELKKALDQLLIDNDRMQVAQTLFQVLPQLAKYEAEGWDIENLLSH